MNIMQNPQAIMLAILFGTVPALLWLWFWLKEDKKHPEPRLLIALAFLFGMLVVLPVLKIEELVYEAFSSQELITVQSASMKARISPEA